jgi:hypothetical protein
VEAWIGEVEPAEGHAKDLNRTVTPRRPPNADLRTREHLTGAEVETLIEAAKDNRCADRVGAVPFDREQRRQTAAVTYGEVDR